MNSFEVSYAMRIIRPAIYAVYKRQKLRMIGYGMVEIEYNDVWDNWLEIKSGWFEVENPNTLQCYKLKIENDKVTYLSMGRLKV